MDAGTGKGIPHLGEVLTHKKERRLALFFLLGRRWRQNRQQQLIFFLHLFLVLLDEGLLDVVRYKLV